ncbi:MAG: APC family permease [Actinobacteria bacterium]|nr:APC family permease [Actinomycetota bacterium]
MSTTSNEATHGSAPGEKGLKGGSLGLVSSIVVGMASTAPAYSLAASLGLVVVALGPDGMKAPAIMLVAFIPMYFIAVAYQEMNKAEPDCGTTFTWATRTFGPWVGWMGGWGIIAADVIVMANLAQVAGSYSFYFLGEIGFTNIAELGDSVFWSTVAGLIWIAVMTWICFRGIEVSARVQYALLGIEVIVLVLFAVVALVKVYTGDAESYSLTPELSWFWPGGLDIGTVVAPALLAAVFIYWGWDTAVACNEEAEDPSTTPGRAAVISTVLLLVTYALVTVAAVAFAGIGTEGVGLGNPENSADVFGAIGPDLFGDSTLGKIGLLLLSASILTSASASTQTTILPTARTALSMAAYRAIPQKFARIHDKYLTPTWATIGMGVVSAAFYLLFTLVSQNLLLALISSVGLMIAFYYGLTGFACAWFYRKTFMKNGRDFVMRFLLPLLGGIILFVAFFYALKVYADPTWITDENDEPITIFGIGAVAVVGVGALILGVILMVWQRVTTPAFFKGETLPLKSHDLILVPAGNEPLFEGSPQPDSALVPTVLAPDLSNLPEGAQVYDPVADRILSEEEVEAIEEEAEAPPQSAGEKPEGDD